MKKYHRFYLSTLPQEATFTITDAEIVHRIHTVLALRVGEVCHFFSDGTDDVVASIVAKSKKEIQVSKIGTIPRRVIPKKVTAAIAISKKDTFEFIAQKLSELGIAHIVPLITERTVKQALREDRLKKISIEATEQSGNATLVTITPPTTLIKYLATVPATDALYCTTQDSGVPAISHTEKTIFFVGPEGGWSDEELDLFKQYTIPPVSLGAPILRTETAAIIAGYTTLWL